MRKYVKPRAKFHELKGERLLDNGSVTGANTERFSRTTLSNTAWGDPEDSNQ